MTVSWDDYSQLNGNIIHSCIQTIPNHQSVILMPYLSFQNMALSANKVPQIPMALSSNHYEFVSWDDDIPNIWKV
jgi:hypothetical protein